MYVLVRLAGDCSPETIFFRIFCCLNSSIRWQKVQERAFSSLNSSHFFPDPLVFSPTKTLTIFLRYCCDSCIMFSCRICTWQKTTRGAQSSPPPLPSNKSVPPYCCFCLYMYVRSSFPNNLLHI